jgi:hypothetical protein
MPTWAKTINLKHVFHNEEMTFTERRDAIVRAIRGSGWPDANFDVADLLFALARTENVESFDEVWQWIYDEADTERVWLATF